MSRAASLLEGRNFVVERLPASAENMGAGDDHIDLMRARFHRAADFCDTLRERREACRKSGGNCSNVNSASLHCVQRSFDESVIHANRPHLNAEFFDTEFLHEILLERLSRLPAQSSHALIRVIARECCQIHARDRAQEPRSLPFFLDGAACHLRLGAAFHGSRVHANVLQPVQIERNADVREERTPGKCGDRTRSVLLARGSLASRFAREVGIDMID